MQFACKTDFFSAQMYICRPSRMHFFVTLCLAVADVIRQTEFFKEAVRDTFGSIEVRRYACAEPVGLVHFSGQDTAEHFNFLRLVPLSPGDEDPAQFIQLY